MGLALDIYDTIDNFFAQDVMKYLIKTHLNQTNQSDHSETS